MMHDIETRILNYGKKIDEKLQNIDEEIKEMCSLIGEIPPNSKLVVEYDDEDDEDDLYDIWIEFPFTETT